MILMVLTREVYTSPWSGQVKSGLGTRRRLDPLRRTESGFQVYQASLDLGRLWAAFSRRGTRPNKRRQAERRAAGPASRNGCGTGTGRA